VASVAKPVRMENLLSQRKYADLLEPFSKKDFSQWPFPLLSLAAFTQVRAQVLNKNAPAAEVDLQTALALTSDKRLRSSIIANLGHNRETNLKDDNAALSACRQNFVGKERIGGADEFRSVQQAASILSRQDKHDEALEALAHIDLDEINGSWRATTLAIKGDLLITAKRTDEARVVYRKALVEASQPSSVRKVVKESLAELLK
jgi:predicted negative regulator of RcsB-dependent stress response